MSGQRRSSTSIEPPRAELTSGTVIGGDAARHQFHSRVTPIWRRTARTRDRLPLGVVSLHRNAKTTLHMRVNIGDSEIAVRRRTRSVFLR